MDATALLRDLATRPRDAARALDRDLSPEILAAHPGGHPNSVAGHSSHATELGRPQGWAERISGLRARAGARAASRGRVARPQSRAVASTGRRDDVRRA